MLATLAVSVCVSVAWALVGAAAEPTTPASGPNTVWTVLSPGDLEIKLAAGARLRIRPDRLTALRIEAEVLDAALSNAPMEFTVAAREQPLLFAVPRPDGGFERFGVVESPVMAPALSCWLASRGWPLRTFKGHSLDTPAATLRFDWGGQSGFHAMVQSPTGSYLVEPLFLDDVLYVVSFRSGSLKPGEQPFACLVEEHATPRTVSSSAASTDGNLRTYRLAVAATGEYTQFHGGTVEAAQAAIVTSVNRVNMVFERDLAVRMILVANNQDLVFPDSTTDPYTNSSPVTMASQNQSVIDSTIGSADYDIGHVLGTCAGGYALIGTPCKSSLKAQAATGTANPAGDIFDIDYLAHEIGHQWGAFHTFNSVSGACGLGGARVTGTAYEPGSGSTIMGYAGGCEEDNLQYYSDDYLHGASLDEMLTYVAGAGACSVNVPTLNTNPPSIDAGASYTVPAATPFELTAASSGDADGDTLTYAWEEFDLGPAASLADGDNGSSPIFRSWPPTTSPSRILPRPDILSQIGETLPTTSRTMTFRLTARDNHPEGGRVAHDTMTVTSTTTSGPFQLTAPHGGTWLGGTQLVTWDPAGTTSAPVSAGTVDILLSDGGHEWSTVLAAGTANDGSELVRIPPVSISRGRIKVKGTNNIFFDVSDGTIKIGLIELFRGSSQLVLPDPGSASLDMDVASSCLITDLNVWIMITHSSVGEVAATLTHLDTGTTVSLIDRPGYPTSATGCQGSDIDAILDDEIPWPLEEECSDSSPTISGYFSPTGSLSAFDGERVGGTWRLTVTDAVGSGEAGDYASLSLIAACSIVFVDNFESGDTTAWSSAVP